MGDELRDRLPIERPAVRDEVAPLERTDGVDRVLVHPSGLVAAGFQIMIPLQDLLGRLDLPGGRVRRAVVVAGHREDGSAQQGKEQQNGKRQLRPAYFARLHVCPPDGTAAAEPGPSSHGY